MSGRRIFIGQLVRDVRRRELEDEFSKYGAIVRIDIKNGFGFIEYERSRSADEAIRKMDGRNFLGRRLIVEYAKGRRKERRKGPERSEYRVIVEGLGRNTSWQDLKDAFRSSGDILFTDVRRDRYDEYYGIVEFRYADDIDYAISRMDGAEVNGHKITVREDKKRRSRRYSRERRDRRSDSRDRKDRRSDSRDRKDRRSDSRDRRRSPSDSYEKKKDRRSESIERRYDDEDDRRYDDDRKDDRKYDDDKRDDDRRDDERRDDRDDDKRDDRRDDRDDDRRDDDRRDDDRRDDRDDDRMDDRRDDDRREDDEPRNEISNNDLRDERVEENGDKGVDQDENKQDRKRDREEDYKDDDDIPDRDAKRPKGDVEEEEKPEDN